MAYSDTKNQKIKDITGKLEQGVKDVFTSEKFAAYLRTMSKFHKYSTRNSMLIHLQKPDATFLQGFSQWKQHGRHVKAGEKGIQILAPDPYKKMVDMEKIDLDIKAPIIGPDDKPVIEQVEITVPKFSIAYIYDISQTDGKPLPSLAEDIKGNVAQYDVFMDTLKAVSPLLRTRLWSFLTNNTPYICCTRTIPRR